MTPAAGPDRELDRCFAGSTESLNEARLDLARFLEANNVEAAGVENAKLVVSELTSNAVQSAPGEEYCVRARVVGQLLMLTVLNRATAADMPARSEWGPDGILDPRGRGLGIVDALSKRVVYRELADSWLEVTAFIPISSDAPR